jgi:hypothetical protein
VYARGNKNLVEAGSRNNNQSPECERREKEQARTEVQERESREQRRENREQKGVLRVCCLEKQ